MVATGDDPEKESPAHTMNDKQEKKATEKQIELMKKIAAEQGKTLDEEVVKNWTTQQASDFISKYKGVK